VRTKPGQRRIIFLNMALPDRRGMTAGQFSLKKQITELRFL